MRVHLSVAQHSGDAVNELARWLGVGPVDSELPQQEWVVDGCRVSLWNEDADSSFTVHAP